MIRRDADRADDDAGAAFDPSHPTIRTPHPLDHVPRSDGHHTPRGASADDTNPDVEALLRATAVARYEPGVLLGTGGMGEVRLCRDSRLGRDVALKTLHQGAAAPNEMRRRFLREVRIQGRLEHPAVVPVHDLGTAADGGMYFTMRRVRGMTLQQVLKGLAVGTPEIVAHYSRRKLLTALAAVCLAVHYAHTRGVLHRDLKPSNVMLGDYGEVYVIDWGIAKVVANADASDDGASLQDHVTERNDVVGTMAYMAPEQFDGEGDGVKLDARTDVYSLGAILYEAVTLRPLLNVASIADALHAWTHGVDARPSAVVPDVPPELDAICTRATQMDRLKRFATARELADAIERVLDGDRDLAMRRDLAATHARTAAAALERTHQKQLSEGEAQAARADAMRDVVRALALDPEHPDARRTLVALLVDVPERLPPAVASEIAQAWHRARARATRFGAYAMMGWLAVIPLALYVGVRSWLAAFLATATTAAAAAFAWRLSRRPTVGAPQSIALAALIYAVCGLTSCWLGPFVLVPAAAAAVSVWCATHAAGWERRAVVVLGVLASLAPFGLELLRIFPPAYAFRNGEVVLFARALSLPPGPTLFALAYTSVGFTVLPAVFLSRMRDALNAAERQLFLQAWQLRQIAPDTHTAPAPR